MSLTISSFFMSGNTPATGLTPTLRIWEVDGITQTLIVGAPNGTVLAVDATMTEVDDGTSQDGFYQYNFTTGYDPTKKYVFRVDGGAGLPASDRYQSGDADPTDASTPAAIADSVWDETATDHLLVGSTGEKLLQTHANSVQLVIDVAAVEALVDLVLKYDTNRTRIDTTTKTLTIYDDDCTTPLRVFNLLDSGGSPSVTEVCERKPVSASDGQPVCS